MADPRVKPILFSGLMIRAILDGRKTMTRRALKLVSLEKATKSIFRPGAEPMHFRLPYAPGDLLWVREGLQCDRMMNLFTGERSASAAVAYYSADDSEALEARGFNVSWVWKRGTLPSIHMPRWASRLTLEVEAVKIERLQDITWEDAQAEGVWHSSPEYREQVCIWRDAPSKLQRLRIEHFAKLWDSINGQRPGCAWADNPWVVAVEFRPHHQNIDAYLAEREAA